MVWLDNLWCNMMWKEIPRGERYKFFIIKPVSKLLSSRFWSAMGKHVVFVLDHSGSMIGRKFEQVVEAMKNILSDLISKDLFDIVWFSEGASVWNVETNTFVDTNISYSHSNYGHLEPTLKVKIDFWCFLRLMILF